MPLKVPVSQPIATVTSGGTTAPAAGTTETWTVDVSVAFGATPDCVFRAVDLTASEVVLVTSCPGGTGTQTWTVTRGAEGTTPVAHPAGFTVIQELTGEGTDLSGAGSVTGLDGLYVPQFQSIAVPSGVPGTAGVATWQVQATGTTNPHAPFADLFLKGIYETSSSDPDTEMIYSWGYNPWQVLKPGEAAIYNTIHPDAGDTDYGGARGIEWLVTFHAPNGSEVNAIEVVGVKDNSGTLNLTFRHGAGADATNDPSGIYFSNASGSVEYMSMSSAYGVQFFQPVGFQVVGNGLIAASATGTNAFQMFAAGGVATFQIISGNGNATAALSGTGATAQTASLQFQQSQTTLWSWDLNYYWGAGYFALTDHANGRMHAYFTPAATANAAGTVLSSQVTVQDNLIVSAGTALATSATHGFLYLPTCAGTPTGTPQPQAGGVPAVVDSADSKLYLYTGGAWKAVTFS